MCSVDLYPSSIPWLSPSFATSDSYTYIQVNLFFSSKQLQFLRVSYFFVSSVKRNGVLFYCCVSYGFRTNNWALIRVIELVYSSSFRKEEPLTLALPKRRRRSSKKIFPPSAWNDPHDGTTTISCLPVYKDHAKWIFMCVHIVVATTEFLNISHVLTFLLLTFLSENFLFISSPDDLTMKIFPFPVRDLRFNGQPNWKKKKKMFWISFFRDDGAAPIFSSRTTTFSIVPRQMMDRLGKKKYFSKKKIKWNLN